MQRIFIFFFLTLLLGCHPTTRRDYSIQPIPFTKVHVQDHFWAPRIETNRIVSIPAAFKQCEQTGRLDNFAIAGGLKNGEHRGDYPFDDTDVYKVIEGASYSLLSHPDENLSAYLDSLIHLIAAAQEDDGYLYTCRTNQCTRLIRWMGEERWQKLNSHELYNMGHLYEAAAAHYQATGKRSLLDVALKNADFIHQTFGTREGQKRQPSGHPIIEMALVKLYRITSDEKYLRLAQFFIDETGYGRDGHQLSEYSQDHKPIVEQDEAVGHAVRAGYLYSGVTDVAAIVNNRRYIEAMDHIWHNVVSKKLYLTGGIGSRGMGEGFGDNYELPNHTAYCETCASIANVFWNHRLFLLHGDGRYIDVLERTLYNALLSGVSLRGDRFFYDNPLESIGQHQRQPWFGCACCPGNVTRFMPSLPGYIYAQQGRKVYVNLFVAGQAEIKIENQPIRIVQETDYPWDGQVKISLQLSKPRQFELYIRIPGWAKNQPVPSDLYRFLDSKNESVGITLNGQLLSANKEKGYVHISRRWRDGDIIELTLPMPVRRIITHEAVEDTRGKVALQCGPLVYCAEWSESVDGHVLHYYLPDEQKLNAEFRADLLGGIKTITGEVFAVRSIRGEGAAELESRDFCAIPYAFWANRGPGEMAVWLAREVDAARPVPLQTIASTSKVAVSCGDTIGLNDQFEPKHSGDTSKPFFIWWLRRGTQEWVQYDFVKPETVSKMKVYWLKVDHHDHQFRPPQVWQLLYRRGDKWLPVENSDIYGVEKDRYNIVRFKPIKTRAVRLQAQLQQECSGGILEWRVE
ncbi:glycoside hydrolase family 127 protein [candidate division KSB1 bacterium]|nr:glycoside hydrolase family 127 protein [candidate division KSB1 bacterium]